MSVNALKPNFTDLAGYKKWRKQWNKVYQEISDRIRKHKKQLKSAQQTVSKYGHDCYATDTLESRLHRRRDMSVNAHKLCTLLDEAKLRMAGITQMKKDMIAHQARFPLTIEKCDRVDFHFNKKHLEYDWIPMWVLKTKGQTFYVHHVNALCPWTTRETPGHESTKGSIRLTKCSLEIDAEGIATLRALEEVEA